MSLALAACGGGDDGNGNGGGNDPAPAAYTLGGSVTGLPGGGSVVLRNSNGDEVTAGNGAFTFPSRLPGGAAYSVTVANVQPAAATCTVGNGSGTAAGDVANVEVHCASAPAPAAGNFAYAGFSNTAGLRLNPSAEVVNTGSRDILRLTPPVANTGGSAYGTQAITLANNYSFSTRFTFNIHDNDIDPVFGTIGADGIAFVIQPLDNSLGGLGGGMGYFGIDPSFVVEFDSYNNPDFDPAPAVTGSRTEGDHIAVMLNGNSANHLAHAMTSPALELNGGQDITAFIDYDGANKLLEVRWSADGLRPAAAGIRYTIDLASLFGTAAVYLGFSASTGANYSAHDIVEWEFRNAYSPISAAPSVTSPVVSPTPTP